MLAEITARYEAKNHATPFGYMTIEKSLFFKMPEKEIFTLPFSEEFF